MLKNIDKVVLDWQVKTGINLNQQFIGIWNLDNQSVIRVSFVAEQKQLFGNVSFALNL